jgi:hypothetical protein
MEVILDELQKNGVNMDMRNLSYYVNVFIKQNEWGYGNMTRQVNRENISEIFYQVKVVNFGSAMAYLSLVYLMKESEEVTREAVRLVAMPMKSFDFSAFKIEDDLFSRLRSFIRCIFNV